MYLLMLTVKWGENNLLFIFIAEERRAPATSVQIKEEDTDQKQTPQD